MNAAIDPADVAKAHAGMRHALIAGSTVLVLLIFGLLGWAALTEITGAVIADGSVVVESSAKKIQHPTGGTVSEIRVKNGDRVKPGDLLIRLDGIEIRSRMDALSHQLAAHRLRVARLTAERDDQPSLVPTLENTALAPEADTAAMIASEKALFESRQAIRKGQRAELEQRILQLRNEIEGIEGQKQAKAAEIDLIDEQLELLDTLEGSPKNESDVRRIGSFSEGVAEKRLALRREAARLRGECGHLRATEAQLKGRIAEIEMQMVRLDHETRSSVISDLAEATAQTLALEQRAVSASDELRRLDIVATTSGTVHESAVRGSGDVIAAGETLMLLIPDSDRLVVEARIDPYQIDRVLAAKTALLRFSAFNRRTTPEIAGRLTRVSADLSRDARTGSAFFIARVEIDDADIAKLGGARLVPGMPVEVQIETEHRTALSYFLKPLEDQLARAWKER
jgi:HlyD family secretion protein